MKCGNCGNEIGNVIGTCPICGAPLETNQDNSYGDPSFNYYAYQGTPPYNPNPNIEHVTTPNYGLYLILSILYIVSCCGIIEGTLAIVFTCFMDKAYKMRDMEKYILYRRLAKWLLIGGVILHITRAIYSFAALIGLIIGDPGAWTYTYT